MSFKYRFILSFVVLQTFFIILIVSINFFAIKTSSEKLTNEKIQTTTILLSQLLKIPISVYDIAILDDLVKIRNKAYINSVIILDSEEKILSEDYAFKYMSKEDLLNLKGNKFFEKNDETYKIKYKKIFYEDVFIGSFYIVFDITSSNQFVKENEVKTILLIMFQILISILLSYFIGNRLTKKLSKLSEVAIKIGKDQKAKIPFSKTTDEIGHLSKSMTKMQKDLTTRKEQLVASNQLLSEQAVELMSLNKAKDDFLANMSHELKTPLNSINVVSSVMQKNRDNNLSQKQIKNLQIINKCGNELLCLINDVLDISKLEAKEISLDCEEINIKDFITNVYETILPQAKEKKLNFVLNINSKITSIYSDEKKIYQIIKNFLSNALKFTKKGTINLVVSDKDEYISISVSDEGIGIPKERLEHIFDRFKQVDTSTSREYGGTGLGLTISQELALLLKGNINIQSTQNVGTKFELVLPKRINQTKIKENKKENNKEESSKEIKQSTSFENKKENILIFNSDPLFFFSITMKLSKKYKVFQSSSSEEFLKIYKKENISRIILDFTTLTNKVLKEFDIHKINNIIAIIDENCNRIYLENNSNILQEIKRSKVDKELENI